MGNVRELQSSMALLTQALIVLSVGASLMICHSGCLTWYLVWLDSGFCRVCVLIESSSVQHAAVLTAARSSSGGRFHQLVSVTGLDSRATYPATFYRCRFARV